MSRYYLLPDYLVGIRSAKRDDEGFYYITPPIASLEDRLEYYADSGTSRPADFTLTRLTSDLYVRVVYDSRDVGFFLLRASNLENAYELAWSIYGYLATFHGVLPKSEKFGLALKELKNVPPKGWTERELVSAFRDSNTLAPEFEIGDFRGGQFLTSELDVMPNYVKAIYSNRVIREALAHLTQSYTLFYGHMTPGFYHYEYRLERIKWTQRYLRKLYLENRPRYEIAYVAAFKAIERFVAGGDIKKQEVNSKLDRLPYKSINSTTAYTRWHEIFLGLPCDITYGEIIRHFLDIRNAVGAHANERPPKKFTLTEDHLYEIQNFAQELLLTALEEITT